jgi:hypothetical protein
VLSGLLTLAALKNVAPNARTTTLIKEIICPLDKVSTARPADPATNLLNGEETCSEGRTLVVDNGALVGVVSPSDINGCCCGRRWVALRLQLATRRLAQPTRADLSLTQARAAAGSGLNPS